MKKKQTNLLLAFLAGLGFLFSTGCQKEALTPAPSSVTSNSPDDYWADFNAFGEGLQEAFSFAVADREFGMLVLRMAEERNDGDTEVLLRRVMAGQLSDGTSGKAHLLKHAAGIFSESEFDAFIEAYPSTIVGVRGPGVVWETAEDYVPPVRFVETTYDEKERTSFAWRQGVRVALDMTQAFDKPVIAIHPSERHTLDGELAGLTNPSLQTRQAPGLSIQDLGETQEIQVICAPEPSVCPTTKPHVNSFTATPDAGGIKLEYNVSNFLPSLCQWGRVEITRFNPDGSTKTWRRFANQPPQFTDYEGNFNFNYSYQINVYIAWVGDHQQYPGQWQWYTCSATNNLQFTSATYPSSGPIMNSYIGTNISKTTIRFDWTPPLGVPVAEYRIRRSTPQGFELLESGIPGSETSYFMTVEREDRGKLIETQIQYRTQGGNWQGAYYDQTYSSHRNPGNPLKFYGLKMQNLSQYEYGESNFYGNPEVRLLAMQGAANGGTNIIAQAVIPMFGCYEVKWYWDGITLVYGPKNTGYFYPYATPGGFTILNQWSADIAGSAIRVFTTETDRSEVVITSGSSIQTRSLDLSTNYSFKVLGNDATVGLDYKTSTTNTYNYTFPDQDIELNSELIYYHEHPTNARNTMLYGYIGFTDRCTNLETHL